MSCKFETAQMRSPFQVLNVFLFIVGSRLLIWGWMVMVTMWWVDGAALQSTMNPPTMQRNNSEPHRNSSIPENLK